jgi:hypothetical protein
VNRRVSLLVYIVVVLAAVLVGGWLRTGYAPEWWPSKPTAADPALRPWAVEADCYSQLARVHRILTGQGLVQNHFTVENWPEGLTPSTTAPFDYVILALYAPLALVTRYPLDWAGALVSPACAIALVIFWASFRSRSFQRVGRVALIFGLALVPALIWATAFGRARHQSLIVALLAVALTAEYERWEKDAGRAWNIAAGIVWGFVCWTSLYEPLFVVILLVVFNFIARRRENAAFGISFGVVMLLALLIEGIHVYVPPPEVRPVLGRWLQFIMEMQGEPVFDVVQGLPAGQMTGFWAWEIGPGILMLALPFSAFFLWRGKNLTDRFLIILTLFLIVCAANQQRWLPYASLAEIFLYARFLQLGPPLRVPQFVLALGFFVHVARVDSIQIEGAAQSTPAQPSPELALLAKSIDQPGGILAPWWLSPGLLYFSGHPIVSGSSHCGITGIEASARFYASTSWREAYQILQQRQVRWVVVWDEPKYVYPLLGSSQEILGQDVSTDEDKGDADETMAQVLITDRDLPDELRLRAVTPHFKLYMVVPSSETRASSASQSPVAVR